MPNVRLFLAWQNVRDDLVNAKFFTNDVCCCCLITSKHNGLDAHSAKTINGRRTCLLYLIGHSNDAKKFALKCKVQWCLCLLSQLLSLGSQLLCADALLLHKASVTCYKVFLANFCREATASNLCKLLNIKRVNCRLPKLLLSIRNNCLCKWVLTLLLKRICILKQLILRSAACTKHVSYTWLALSKRSRLIKNNHGCSYRPLKRLSGLH